MAFNQTYDEALTKARSKPSRPRKPMSRGTRGLNGGSFASKTSQAGFSGKPTNGPKRGSLGRGKATEAKGKGKQKKLMTRKRAVKVLDGLTSQIVRLRDGKCVQCGTTEKLTCGHVLSRRSHATRWDLNNCFAQCWPHNFAHGSYSPVPYFQWYVITFSQETFDALYLKWSKGQKFSTPELRSMVVEYQAQLESMKERSR